MIKFGPSGNDVMFYDMGYNDSVDAPKFIKDMGLDCYEYPCGRGVTISSEKALKIAEMAKKYDIEMSVHAPYFINFASNEQERIDKSISYVMQSLKLVKLFGGKRVVVHTGSNGKLSREQAMENAKNNLAKLASVIHKEGYDNYLICLETMGKYSQIGNVEEIVELCKIDKCFIPTFDFGHINCIMQGALTEKQHFLNIFNYAIEQLGIDKIKNVHIHFSQIEFSAKGELKHTVIDNGKYGPNFEPLAQAIDSLGLEPVIICESKDVMAQDALKLKKMYKTICKKQ